MAGLIEDVPNRSTTDLLVNDSNFDALVFTEEAIDWTQVQAWLRRWDGGRWLFRGQTEGHWQLTSSLERATLWPAHITQPGATASTVVSFDPDHWERELLFRFQRQAHQYLSTLPAEDSVLDWLALMQHHGAPTRLLDWTRAPYVALYFAVENPPKSSHVALWAIDSDWVLAEGGDLAKARNSYTPSAATLERQRLKRLNRMLLEGCSQDIVAIANPVTMNQRMATQQGLFLCNLSQNYPLRSALLNMLIDLKTYRPVLNKLVITEGARISILKELNRMNINRASLFPGLDGFAQSLRVDLQFLIFDELGPSAAL